jgi:hypothetical protein
MLPRFFGAQSQLWILRDFMPRQRLSDLSDSLAEYRKPPGRGERLACSPVMINGGAPPRVVGDLVRLPLDSLPCGPLE